MKILKKYFFCFKFFKETRWVTNVSFQQFLRLAGTVPEA